MLINQKETRDFILSKCEEIRPNLGLERVSKDALTLIDIYLQDMILDMIQNHPSKGKTFKLPKV